MIFTFPKQAFNYFFRFFANVHSLMNKLILIDSCKAHLPVHYASNIEFIHW